MTDKDQKDEFIDEDCWAEDNVEQSSTNLDKKDSYTNDGFCFPKPLSKEKEKEYFIKIAQGDREARKILAEHNLRLVAYFTRRYSHFGMDIDELINIGTIGLLKAIDTYKLDKKVRFASYAYYCIKNEIFMYMRSNRTGSYILISLEEAINFDDDQAKLEDTLGTEYDVVASAVENQMEYDILNEGLESLSEKEKIIIYLRFWKMMTQADVAQCLGISRSYVSHKQKQILTKLSKKFGK